MTTEKQRFTLRASASRLDKGLLAIPQKFRSWFPGEKGQIQVVFDDEQKAKALTFHPYDPTVKENRIFGLRNWFSKRNVGEGDLISITVEDVRKRLYRIALDRYVRDRQEQQARQTLRVARTDSEAAQGLATLSQLTRKRPRETARQELLRIAQGSERRPRPRVSPGAIECHEGTPSGIRLLLREVHDGKCQLCTFTFEKRNGEPYFEIHHLEPDIGHHPSNLLVVCANCHAQLEHAFVANFTWAGIWLIGVTINGRRISIRQPLADDSMRCALLGLVVVVAGAHVATAHAVAVTQMGRLLLR